MRVFVVPVLSALILSAAWAGPQDLKSGAQVAWQPGWQMFFEAMPAQDGAPSSYLARGQNYQLLISAAEVDFILRKPLSSTRHDSVRREEAIDVNAAPPQTMTMSFKAANPLAGISGLGQLAGKINYLVGNDPGRWRAEVPIFAQVQIRDLYPGIDLIYYGNQKQLEYDFTIAPQSNPSVICFQFEGTDKLAISQNGELIIPLGDAELRQHRPVIYQMVRGVRHEVSGGYQLRNANTVGFVVCDYDHDLPLVIDPVFTYSTYFGGTGGDTGLAIKVDGDGSIYLAGETLSAQFPPSSTAPFQANMHGGKFTGDAFIAKLDNTASNLLYFTYLGGSGDDGAYDLAIDTAGNAYVTGFTVSPDFPTQNALFKQISGTPDGTFHLYPLEVFVAELNTNGSGLVFSTYLGGSNKDVGSSIAVDPSGNIYVAGYSYSTNFPVRNALQSALRGNDDAFVAKFAPRGARLIYSTYLGGVGIDEAEGIATDASGSAYLAGYTDSTNFPITANAVLTKLNTSGVSVSVFDGFVTRLGPYGSNIVYSTYLGGNENDYAYRIAVDSSGNAYVTGSTQSTNFPHADLFGLSLGENGTNVVNFDAFLTKLSTNGAILYSAQFGGTGNDAGWDVAVDPAGRAFVIGVTVSTNFPIANRFGLFRTENAGFKDLFVTAFETNAGPVLYSGYLGGIADDFGYGIAVDSEANAYISGMTFSTNFPVTTGSFEGHLSGISDSFVAKIRLMDPMLSVVTVDDTLQISWPATAPDFQLQSALELSPPQVWNHIPQTPLVTNGEYLVVLPATNSSALFRLLRP